MTVLVDLILILWLCKER